MATIENTYGKFFMIPQFLLIFPLKVGKEGFRPSLWLTTCCSVHLLFLMFSTIRYLIVEYGSKAILGERSFIILVFVFEFIIMLFSLVLYVISHFSSTIPLNALLRDLKGIDTLLYDYLTTSQVHNPFRLPFIVALFLIIVCAVDILSYGDELFGVVVFYWMFYLTLMVMYHFVQLIEIFLTRFTILNQRVDGMLHLQLPPLRLLIIMTKIYRRLTECVYKANRIYSFQLLSYFFTYFFVLAANSFFFIDIRETDVYTKLGQTFVLGSWILIVAFSLYSILRRTQSVMFEAKEFKAKLYQIMLCDQTGILLNDPTLQLHIASKREITFTAAGFFTLDLRLLVAIAGAVTTYGVILIQMSQRKN